MNLPKIFKQTQLTTYSKDLHTDSVCSSFQDFLSEKTPVLYQNNNNQKQAYLFLTQTSLNLVENEITLSSPLILNFNDFDNETGSQLRIISNDFRNLNKFLSSAGYQINQQKGFIEITFQNIITKNLTSFRLEKELVWQKSQFESLEYTQNYSMGLDLQATTDIQPLEKTLKKYFEKQKLLLPKNIQRLIF
jgi:hypothetical protein